MKKTTVSSESAIMRTLIGIFLFVFSISMQAQDKIIKKGGETLEVKILEISPNEVKYQLLSEPNGPIFIMDKDRILEIIFENGRVEKYVSPLIDAEFYVEQKKRAVKMNFLSPLLGYTQLSYEQSLKPGRSYEVSLGIIGLGRNQELEHWNGTSHKENQAGVFGSFGYKFKRVPDFTANNQKYGHILQGLYVKPELMIGYLTNNGYNYDTQTSVKRKTTFGAALVNLGKQWVFSDAFVIDLYGGVGYALKTRSDDNGNYYNSEGRLYGVITGTDDADFAFSGGFRIGFLLK